MHSTFTDVTSATVPIGQGEHGLFSRAPAQPLVAEAEGPDPTSPDPFCTHEGSQPFGFCLQFPDSAITSDQQKPAEINYIFLPSG